MPEERRGENQGFLYSLFDYLYKFFIAFIIINTIGNFLLKPNQKAKNQSIEVITIEQAKLITKQKLDDQKLKYQQAKDMFGIAREPEFIMPVFPTVNHYNEFLYPHQMIPAYHEEFQLYVYLTSKKKFDHERDHSKLIWSIPSIVLDWTYKDSPTLEINVTATPHLHNNGSLYAHVFLISKKMTLTNTEDSSSGGADNHIEFHKIFPLIKYKLKKRKSVERKLLKSQDLSLGEVNPSIDIFLMITLLRLDLTTSQNPKIDDTMDGIRGYWKPRLDIAVVLDMPTTFDRNTIPDVIGEHLTFVDNVQANFEPLIIHNDFWLLSKDYIEINDTVSTLPLAITYQHIAFWRWQLQIAMEASFKQQSQMGLMTQTTSDKETDMIREMLKETSPWLLGVTFVVSMLHMILDVLAFKNDVQFWRKRKSMAGLSMRSLVVNCFFQTIILLYLVDNDTSILILISSGVGLLIEYWKLGKMFNVQLIWYDEIANENFDGIKRKTRSIPKISYGLAESYINHTTQEHDTTATTHLMYIIIPLVVGYSAYSLLHIEHKSFYSWAIGSLVGFVYAFGFVLMTPQLFINYKLKSVAHMPWNAMIYKALNTFIDDLFAFIIKMPILHRIACFRDDLIFFIYLYQKWIYPVDYTRENEFGQVGADPSDAQDALQIISTASDKSDNPVSSGSDKLAVASPSDE